MIQEEYLQIYSYGDYIRRDLITVVDDDFVVVDTEISDELIKQLERKMQLDRKRLAAARKLKFYKVSILEHDVAEVRRRREEWCEEIPFQKGRRWMYLSPAPTDDIELIQVFYFENVDDALQFKLIFGGEQ